MKSNRNILYAIHTIQLKSNKHVHEFSKIRKAIHIYDQQRDEKFYFVKYEGWKNLFCKIWETMDRIMWNIIWQFWP